jgi:hypothetical protein
MDGDVVAPAIAPTLAWPGEETAERSLAEPDSDSDSLWGRSRDFDWGE